MRLLFLSEEEIFIFWRKSWDLSECAWTYFGNIGHAAIVDWLPFFMWGILEIIFVVPRLVICICKGGNKTIIPPLPLASYTWHFLQLVVMLNLDHCRNLFFYWSLVLSKSKIIFLFLLWWHAHFTCGLNHKKCGFHFCPYISYFLYKTTLSSRSSSLDLSELFCHSPSSNPGFKFDSFATCHHTIRPYLHYNFSPNSQYKIKYYFYNNIY